MTPDYWLLLFILFTVMIISVKKDKLTWPGAIAGGTIGFLIYFGARFTGIAMIGSFFLLGTLATSWKINMKYKLGASEMNSGRRTAGQVIANGGVAGVAGLLSWFLIEQSFIFRLMMAAALASATADTLSSELGTVYGKKFYNILSLKADKRGENGVVSIEGTFIGILGSMLIAAIYGIGFGWNNQFAWIVIAGTFGNITDSILGATLERKKYLNNNAVNFINTLIAALTAFVFAKLFI